MPYEELTMWAIRYDYGKFGKKVDDYRSAMQAKFTAESFGGGKDIPLEKYMPKFERMEKKKTQVRNLVSVAAIFGGVIPVEVIEKELGNGNSSDTDSASQA